MEQLDDQESADFRQRLQEASALSDEGRWPEAIDILLAEESEHPRDPVLMCMLGVAAQELGADGRAYDYFRRCIAEHPGDPLLLVTAGNGLAHYDDPEAESTLRLAAVTAPTLMIARLYYGSYLLREGLLDLATAELEAAKDLEEEDPRIHRELAAAYYLRDRRSDAIDQLDLALSFDDDDSDLRLLYGLVLLDDGQTAEGAEEIHRASAEIPADTEAQLLCALACAAHDWSDEAWLAHARAEDGITAPLLPTLQEVEELLEAGPDAADSYLREQFAPSMLRERLLERP